MIIDDALNAPISSFFALCRKKVIVSNISVLLLNTLRLRRSSATCCHVRYTLSVTVKLTFFVFFFAVVFFSVNGLPPCKNILLQA
jgi:hypothetical protein